MFVFRLKCCFKGPLYLISVPFMPPHVFGMKINLVEPCRPHNPEPALSFFFSHSLVHPNITHQTTLHFMFIGTSQSRPWMCISVPGRSRSPTTTGDVPAALPPARCSLTQAEAKMAAHGKHLESV